MRYPKVMSLSSTRLPVVSRSERLADAAACLYVALLTLAVAAHIGAVAVAIWATGAAVIAYRKAAR